MTDKFSISQSENLLLYDVYKPILTEIFNVLESKGITAELYFGDELCRMLAVFVHVDGKVFIINNTNDGNIKIYNDVPAVSSRGWEVEEYFEISDPDCINKVVNYFVRS